MREAFFLVCIERKQWLLAHEARVAGIVEHLDVRAPLTAVKQGQALLTLLAPDWTAAQEEYLSLRRSHTQGLDELRAAARQRLSLLGMSEGQIHSVEQSGRAQTRITLAAPRDGVVGELAVREGASVMAGAPLLRINGLDTVWINAAIPEAQAGRVVSASSVNAQVPAFPGERFAGKIESLLPDIDMATRTQTARIVLNNPGHRLAPGMFAQLEIDGSKDQANGVLVPTDAVIATGTRNVIIVDDGSGHFRAQEVRTGDESGGKTQILEGIKEGETAVLSGQFLIDSEASLTGTLARLQGGTEQHDSTGAPAEPHGDQATSAHELHLAQGTITRIDGDQWTIATDAIASLDMGAMTMTFVCPQRVPAANIRPGQRVSFSFFRNAGGDFEIDKITVLAPASATPAPAKAGGGKP